MTALYADRFKPLGIQDIWPDPEYQEILLDVIKSVKKGDTGRKVCNAYKTVCKNLQTKGASTAVVACTELSVLDIPLPVHNVDAAQVLAMEIVRKAKSA